MTNFAQMYTDGQVDEPGIFRWRGLELGFTRYEDGRPIVLDMEVFDEEAFMAYVESAGGAEELRSQWASQGKALQGQLDSIDHIYLSLHEDEAEAEIWECMP